MSKWVNEYEDILTFFAEKGLNGSEVSLQIECQLKCCGQPFQISLIIAPGFSYFQKEKKVQENLTHARIR